MPKNTTPLLADETLYFFERPLLLQVWQKIDALGYDKHIVMIRTYQHMHFIRFTSRAIALCICGELELAIDDTTVTPVTDPPPSTT